MKSRWSLNWIFHHSLLNLLRTDGSGRALTSALPRINYGNYCDCLRQWARIILKCNSRVELKWQSWGAEHPLIKYLIYWTMAVEDYRIRQNKGSLSTWVTCVRSKGWWVLVTPSNSLRSFAFGVNEQKHLAKYEKIESTNYNCSLENWTT